MGEDGFRIYNFSYWASKNRFKQIENIKVDEYEVIW